MRDRPKTRPDPFPDPCRLASAAPRRMGRSGPGRPAGRLLAPALAALLAATACGGRHEGPGEVTAAGVPPAAVEERERRQFLPESGDSRILFGDLHVHTTFSADAFAMSLPLMGGEGARPPADACDYARFCAGLDFWSVTDHAENLTPLHWRETVESLRQCNAVAQDPAAPDTVAFLGWEWSQVGDSPENHWGHKNVVLRSEEAGRVPARPIAAPRPEFKGVSLPRSAYLGMLLRSFPNHRRYFDQAVYQREIQAVPYCPSGVDTRELPDDCLEVAQTPADLFRKLDEWGYPALVIPHGTTWGLMTPPGTRFDGQLAPGQHDPSRQRLFEIYSGHGSAEEYREYRALAAGPDGGAVCPETLPGGGPGEPAYEPCCRRAGEIVRARCESEGGGDCDARAAQARRHFAEAGVAGYQTVPGTTAEDWLDCGQCPDCFAAALDHRPAASAQYALALSEPGDGGPRRLRLGMIGSSDSHRARAGNGFKERDRRRITDAGATFDRALGTSEAPEARSRAVRLADLPLQRRRYMERQSSMYLSGGLVAVHAEGRGREAIWDALHARRAYATSGDRILLFFELLNAPGGPAPMGSEVELAAEPRFRAVARGALEQRPGCPSHVEAALDPERLRSLCLGECHHPGEARRRIDRIEVVRIRPQADPAEPVGELIEDPWLGFDCPEGLADCSVEFSDPDFAASGRDAVYYVRAIQEPTPAINAEGFRCTRDEAGRCVEVSPCHGDDRTPLDDDCLAALEERAWSSPIFVDRAGAVAEAAVAYSEP